MLELGRLGENEAIFALFIAGSLLVWHGLYARGNWAAAWAFGGALAGLALLQKGIQGPVYFAAATGMFLLVRRDWRALFSWQHLLGWCAFAAVWLAWQIPFYLATDWETSVAMWTRTVAHRFTFRGLLEHWGTYPLETFACLLPWSPLLVGLAFPKFRRSLGDRPTQVAFLITAILITYPSVLIAAHSRGRYFLPLYPCFALLVGFVIERSVSVAADTAAWRAWRGYLLVLAGIVVAVAGGAAVVAFLPQPELAKFQAEPWFAVLVLLPVALAVAAILFVARRRREPRLALAAVTAIAAFLALAHLGVVNAGKARAAADVAAIVGELRGELPPGEQLVSLGAIDHRFAYFYGEPIEQFSWPETPEAAPSDVRYFVFMRRAGDTPERRVEGRGVTWGHTSGTLPFAWEEVRAISTSRFPDSNPHEWIVLGRVREGAAEVSQRPADNRSR